MKKRILSLIMILSVITTLFIPIQSAQASDWVLESQVPAGTVITDVKYVYDYTSTTQSSSSSLEGWTKTGSSWAWGSWGSWSDWSDKERIESDSRDVKTRKRYNYYRWSDSYNGSKGSKNETSILNTKYTYKIGDKLSSNGSGGYKLYHNSKGDYDSNGKNFHSVWKRTKFETTQYKYRDRKKVYTYYYKKVETKESSSYPSGNNISNVRKYVRYEYNTFYLDLNGLLDDANANNISGFGTADVYINGVLVEDDAQDFYGVYAYGTNYTITDIKPISGYTYNGVTAGSLSGTLTGDMTVVLKFYSVRKITYNANGGDNAPKEQDKPYGINVNITEEKPERTGYTFVGWNTAYDGSGKKYSPGEIYSGNDNLTPYAQWQANQFIINYDGNGAVGEMPPISYTYNGTSNFPNCDFTKKGYTFAGWSQNPSAEIGEYKVGEKVPNLAVSGEVTLYAIWQPNEYKIKYITYDDDGNPVQMQAETFAKYGTGMITLAKIENERAGYDFKGWSTNKNATVPKYAKEDGKDTIEADSTELSSGEDVVLYSIWKEKPKANEVQINEVLGDGKKTVTMTTGTSGAKIYYTLDGTDPTADSISYDTNKPEFNTEGTYIIKARAFKEGYNPSKVAELLVDVKKTPNVIVNQNNISMGKSVTMTLGEQNGDCSIYYTTDGTDPATSATRAKYYNELQYCQATNIEIKAVAIAKGYVIGEVSSVVLNVEELKAPELKVAELYTKGAVVEAINNAGNASIYYTVENGENPLYSSNKQLYDANTAIEIENNTDHVANIIVRAAAMRDGFAPGKVCDIQVNVSDRDVKIPSAQISRVYGGKMLSLSCETEDAVIYYTEDGSEPDTKSTPYNGEFLVDESKTIKSKAIYDGIFESQVLETKVTVEGKMGKPVITLETGDEMTKVTIEGTSTASTIYYTLDTSGNSEPIKYTGPFYVTQKTQIRAYAVRTGYATSDIAEAEAIVLAKATVDVQTLNASDITENSARLNGVFSNSNGTVLEKSFIYYEKNNPASVNYIRVEGDSSAIVSNLTPDTEYWYQAMAVNVKGIGSGTVKSFRTLKGNNVPTDIKLSPEFMSMNVGDKRNVMIRISNADQDNLKLIWSSENPKVAKVNQKGVIEALSNGSTLINVKSSVGNIKGTMQVVVTGTEINGELDFSEFSMAKSVSEIWNKNNPDKTFKVDGLYFGGNSVMSTAYLARWGGTVLENRDPYPTDLSSLNVTQYTPDYHVQEVLFLPARKDALDNNDIKRAIMEYGAVYAEFQVDYNYFDISHGNKKNYYLENKDDNQAKGHAVAIVGWDDNYSKRYFKGGCRPPADGAFICKNSWGTQDKKGSIGEDGYFYISYYDPYIGRHGINAVFNNLESNTNYSKNYQYDPLGPVMGQEYMGGEVFVSNVFPSKDKALANDEMLKAVSFYTADKGYSYEVYVIPDFNNEDFFDNLGSCVKRGIMEYAGYHTVKLDSPIELKAGSRFAVIIRLTSTEGKVATYFEAPLESMAAQNAVAHEGESYVSTDGNDWKDVHVEILKNTNVCVKAFTDVADDSALMMSEEISDNDEPTTVTVDEAISKGFKINPEFIEKLDSVQLFNETDGGYGIVESPSIIVGNNNINNTEGIRFDKKFDLRKVKSTSKIKDQGSLNTCWAFATYASLESCLMKKAQNTKYYEGMSGASGESAVSLGNMYIPVIDVKLEQENIKIAKGHSMNMNAEVTPFNATDKALTWESSNPNVVSVDTSGNVYALELGETTITATNSDSGCKATCILTVTEPQPITGLRVNDKELYFNVGDEIVVDYNVLPSNALKTDATYSATDETIVVEEDGVLYAAAEGETDVIVSTLDGQFSDKFHIYVSAEEPSELYGEFTIEAESTETAVEADLINGNNESETVDIYYAVYDTNTGKLKSTSCKKNIEISSNDLYTYISDAPLAEGETAKIFAWRADTMISVCDAESVE